MSQSRSLLSGLKVLDLGTFVFGPAAATVMSDFGADVIKIEPPGIGDPYRYLSKMPPLPACDQNYCWILTSRNKKSVALDLKKEQAREILLDLVRETDVVITNLPAAVLQRLRVTYVDLKAINPRLIYAHATGYGEHGDEAGKPGYDATAWWARSGLMELVRDHRDEILELIEGMENKSAEAIEETIYKRVKLDLCPSCQRTFVRDPIRFQAGRGATADEFDVDGFLRSLGYGGGPIEHGEDRAD